MIFKGNSITSYGLARATLWTNEISAFQSDITYRKLQNKSTLAENVFIGICHIVYKKHLQQSYCILGGRLITHDPLINHFDK